MGEKRVPSIRGFGSTTALKFLEHRKENNPRDGEQRESKTAWLYLSDADEEIRGHERKVRASAH